VPVKKGDVGDTTAMTEMCRRLRTAGERRLRCGNRIRLRTDGGFEKVTITAESLNTNVDDVEEKSTSRCVV
jgi:hypothetical protein